jgi:MSHA biogenesis protein MshN
MAIIAILFALTDINALLGKNQQNNTQSVKVMPKKMAVVPQETEVQEAAALSQTIVKTPQTPIAEVELNTNEQKSLAAELLQDATPQTKPINSTNINSAQIQAKTSAPNALANTSDDETVDPEPAVASQTSFSMTGSSQENKTNSLKQRIAESLNGNDKELAQKLLSQLLLEQPDNLQARKKLASLYFAQGNFIQTRLLLQQGIEQNPNQADLRLMLARLYTAQKDVPKAMSVLTAYQPSEGNRTDYLAYRAALAQQLNQAQIAKMDYQTLTSIDATNAKWWLGLGIAEDKLGQITQALQAYQQANSLSQLDGTVSDFVTQRITVLAGSQ